jgi:hypothetical protein
MLSNIVADLLAVIITRENADGQVGSLIPNLVEREFSFCKTPMKQSFFVEHDLEKGCKHKINP